MRENIMREREGKGEGRGKTERENEEKLMRDTHKIHDP